MIKSIEMVVEMNPTTKDTYDDMKDIVAVICAKQDGAVVTENVVGLDKGCNRARVRYDIAFRIYPESEKESKVKKWVTLGRSEWDRRKLKHGKFSKGGGK